MASHDNKQPIIIKRKKSGHGEHHGGAWKVAFADFMTAMMAFFLVMWLVNQSDSVKAAVAAYFRDPGNFATRGGAGVLEGSRSILPGEDNNQASPKPEVAPANNPSGPSEKEQSELNLLKETILNELKKIDAYQRLQKNVKIELTSEGLRIVLNESENSPAFFEPGSPKLLRGSAVVLIKIAEELGKLKNRLVIEGHTDAAFGGSREYTNWELSADRANAARRLMEVSGLYAGQIREVRGFADTFPMITEDPYDARNRRVTIVVLYRYRDRQYDALEVGGEIMNSIE